MKQKKVRQTISGSTVVMYQQGVMYHRQGQLGQAKVLYEQVLQGDARHFGALHMLGVVEYQFKNAERAVELISKAIQCGDKQASAHSNLGNALEALGRYEEAILSFDRAIKLKPDYADAYKNRGVAHKNLKRWEAALRDFEQAAKLNPNDAQAHNNRGNVLRELGREEEALSSLEHALVLNPNYAEAYNNRGNVLKALQRLPEALASYERAIEIKPDYPEAYSDLGVVYLALNKAQAALACFETALSMQPEFPEAYSNQSLAWLDLGQPQQALACCERALALREPFAFAYNNQGLALFQLRRLSEALASYQRALELQPDFAFLPGMVPHLRMQLVRWSNYRSDVEHLARAIEAGKRMSNPFPVMGLIDSPRLQRMSANIWRTKWGPCEVTEPFRAGCGGADRSSTKIRVGYYSADFHNHATAYLMAELFEAHDRDKFEPVAFSFGPDRQDEMRHRVRAAFDRFIDVRQMSDVEVARCSRELGIDIAIDLKGYTQDSRPGIFVQRAAPVQVNYLGYPGTMALEAMDYIIGDPVVIPEGAEPYYTEKIIRLPHSYQVNDAKRRISKTVYSKTELGLPEAGFVYCCFNNTYKITPDTFDNWMRILKQVPGSVLWLLKDNEEAMDNLRREAEARGVEGSRLVFAPRMALAEHLARHRAADLFLDTLPCNAHTTASDALWAGLPVLTRLGQAFAGRVAASLLRAVGLEALITQDADTYEALAVELARDPQKLQGLKRKLEQNKMEAPLFDAKRFARHLETAYEKMHERSLKSLPPEHISITP